MRIYLDSCCYNRPYDDQSQNRVHDESEAVLSLLHRSKSGGDIILGSEILEWEMEQISDVGRRFKVFTLYRSAKESIPYAACIKERAENLQAQAAIRTMDSLHIASAEVGKADVFLTTDDRLIRVCRKLALDIRVMNPVSYLAEVIEYDQSERE